MPSPRDILRLARPGDWTKNSFVLLAFVFWLANTNPPHTAEEVRAKLTAALVAFASFCLVASGFYSINDAIDAEKDRGHPVKCRRPVASGAISQRAAIVIGVILVSAAIAAAASVSKALAATVIAYALLQVAYNARLKRVAFIDVMTIATGFALRAGAGALAIEVQVSVWLLLCVFFLCLYLGFIKRMCDFVAAERAGSSWKSPAGYRGRDELQWLLGVSAVITTIAYLSYAMSDHTWKIFGARATGLALLTPLVLAAIHRFWRRANEGSSDSPLDALRSDPVVFATITIYGALLGVVLFVPAAKDMLERVFLQHYG